VHNGEAVVPAVVIQLAILVTHCPATKVDPVAHDVHVKTVIDPDVPVYVPEVQLAV